MNNKPPNMPMEIKEHYSDELEQQVGEALSASKIKFERKGHRLDFFLPDFDVYIEVKKYHSERANAQLATQENIILVQGKKAVKTFCDHFLKRIE